MEFTRELRYKHYDQWDAETLLKLQRQANLSPYQLKFHIRPSSGLLNDPNGFSYFNGKYHVFYQSYPFGAVHGLKSWVHLTSPDLVHWENLGLAVNADTEFDSHGAYSGSAIAVDDQLFLMYTGNHRTADWERIPYQLGAYLDKNGNVTKLAEPLFKNPAGITEHFRDPQIINKDGVYYAIIGAQTDAEKGCVMYYKSTNLKHWENQGFLDIGETELGYMIECPNLVKVDDKYVLIFCPQGIDKQVFDYDNVYPNAYIIADDVDFENGKLINPSPLFNLDDGFDVYATQAFNHENHAYAISWVGLPDSTYPTDDENWANCLSQVKELHIKDGKLFQTPVKAIETLHGKEVSADQLGQQFHAKIKLSGPISLNVCGLDIKYDHQTLTVDRQASLPTNTDFGTKRSVELASLTDLEIFFDHSLFEIFVNGGEKVITGRYFNLQNSGKIVGDNLQVQAWEMKDI